MRRNRRSRVGRIAALLVAAIAAADIEPDKRPLIFGWPEACWGIPVPGEMPHNPELILIGPEYFLQPECI